jgi:hypothetical protein
MMNEMPCPLSIARTRSGPPRVCATDESHFIRPCARAQLQYGWVADSASDPPIQSNALDLVNKLHESGNSDHAHRSARCSRACRAAVSTTGPGGGAHALEGVLFAPHDGLHPEARGIKALSLELTRARDKRGARRRVMLYALERIRMCFRPRYRCEGGERGVG